MPRSRRKFKKHRLYHVYNRGNRKQVVFKEVNDYKFFLFKMYQLQNKYSLQVKAYCLMDNHFHLLIKTGSDPGELSKFMQRLLTSLCLYINKRYGFVGHVFQGRFRASLITSEGYKSRLIKYFKQNPIKAGYARVWHQYRWIRIDDDL